MAELARPYPGWTPPRIGSRGECLRLAFACAAGVHPIRVNYIEAENPEVDFWGDWETEFLRQGFRFQRAELFEAQRCGRHWIAVVKSLRNPANPVKLHAVVMFGSKLVYDGAVPRYQRKQRPHKFAGNPIIPVPIA
jgi:hypothetical protein